MSPLYARARYVRVALLVVCLAVPACGKSKITRANYDQIKDGMTLQQVEALLGPGTKEEGDGSGVAAQFGVDVPQAERSRAVETYVWERGGKSITVYIVNGKVTNKKASGL
jgi:hypothetical protein